MAVLRFFIWSFFTAILGSSAYQALAETEANGLTMAVTSAAGREVTLNFSQEVITSVVKSAVVCTQPALALTLAKLWMPDMGHGSSPTTLVPQDESCTRVDRLNFLMAGEWELRVTLADGDTAVFAFQVAE